MKNGLKAFLLFSRPRMDLIQPIAVIEAESAVDAAQIAGGTLVVVHGESFVEFPSILFELPTPPDDGNVFHYRCMGMTLEFHEDMPEYALLNARQPLVFPILELPLLREETSISQF